MSDTFVFKVKMAIGSLSLLAIIAIIALAISLSTKKAEEHDESQLWKLNGDKLENAFCTWKLASKIWKIPGPGESGDITNDSEILIHDENNKIIADEVILKEKSVKTGFQTWLVGTKNSEGWFTIKHNATGKYLTTENNESECIATLKDFIGKNYYGTLTAGDSSDLNVGGVTQTNNMISGVSGCKGEAVVEPPFKRGDIIKENEDGFGKSFTIKCNKNKDGCRTNNIEIKGTCCWEILDRNGNDQEFTPGQDKEPTIAYISKLKTKKCA